MLVKLCGWLACLLPAKCWHELARSVYYSHQLFSRHNIQMNYYLTNEPDLSAPYHDLDTVKLVLSCSVSTGYVQKSANLTMHNQNPCSASCKATPMFQDHRTSQLEMELSNNAWNY
ncbi:hypothetical protein ACMFMG_011049 [Clarireedia jacksonii]